MYNLCCGVNQLVAPRTLPWPRTRRPGQFVSRGGGDFGYGLPPPDAAAASPETTCVVLKVVSPGGRRR